jgi:hypothetical protein
VLAQVFAGGSAKSSEEPRTNQRQPYVYVAKGGECGCSHQLLELAPSIDVLADVSVRRARSPALGPLRGPRTAPALVGQQVRTKGTPGFKASVWTADRNARAERGKDWFPMLTETPAAWNIALGSADGSSLRVLLIAVHALHPLRSTVCLRSRYAGSSRSSRDR